MKKTKVIKKTDVIEALKNEQLTRGAWFDGVRGHAGIEYSIDCKVCAVGAVLRKVSFEKWARKHSSLRDLGNEAVRAKYVYYSIGGGSVSSTEAALKDRNYLGALSNYFELGNSKKSCIAFVVKYFPKSFKLTITL